MATSTLMKFHVPVVGESETTEHTTTVDEEIYFSEQHREFEGLNVSLEKCIEDINSGYDDTDFQMRFMIRSNIQKEVTIYKERLLTIFKTELERYKQLLLKLHVRTGFDVTDSGGDRTYKVTVYNGKVGTDSNVYIGLYGDEGHTRPEFIDANKTFKADSPTEFSLVKQPFVGNIMKVRIGHDSSRSPSPSWIINKVAVEDEQSKRVFEFQCEKEIQNLDIEKQEAFYMLLQTPTKPETKQQVNPVHTKNQKYMLTVQTGKEAFAGTDAKISIVLCGEKGKSELIPLSSSNEDFERGGKDKFVIQTVEIGELKNVKIQHDNSGILPKWNLEKIIVQHDTTEYEFAYNDWIAKGDNKTIKRSRMVKEEIEGDSKVTVEVDHQGGRRIISKKKIVVTTKKETHTHGRLAGIAGPQ